MKATPRAQLLGSSGSYSSQALHTPMRGGHTRSMVTPPRKHSRGSGYTQLPDSYLDVPEGPVNKNELSGWERVKAIARSFKPQNAREFGRMLDPLALLFWWGFNMGTVGVGLWQLARVAHKNTTSEFMFDSPLT